MIKTKTIVLFILLLFTFVSGKAQVTNEKISLKIVLNDIQKKFGYHFSYLDNDVKDITVIKPSDSLDFDSIIIYLEKRTPFIYTTLNDLTIALSLKQNLIEVCGTLLDTDKQVIGSATIQTQNFSTISDSSGEFRIKVNSNTELITINHLGYYPIKIDVKDFDINTCKEIILTPQVEYLNEILLRDYLIKGINKQTDGSIAINYDNFGVLPGLLEPNLLQTIQALPGILSVNETISDINVRGGTNDQNLILWDGIKMYQTSHFFGLISAFNPYLTKNVKLFKNGSSAAYGDGVSSVIAMNTSNKISKDTNTSIGVNLISVDGYTDTPIGKKSSLQFAVRHSINGIIETPTYQKYFDKTFQNSEVIDVRSSDDQFSFYDTSIRWIYKVTSKDFIKINALIMHNDLRFQENSIINQLNIARESSLEQNNNAGGILYFKEWSSTFQSKILAYGTDYKLKAINSDIENNQRLLQENHVLENGIKLDALYKPSTRYNFKTGYQFNETGISNLQDLNNPVFRDRIKEVLRTHSIFSEIEYRSSSEKDLLHVGVRLNYFEKFDKYVIEPRISFHKRFANHFTLEFLGEIKNQTTSQVIDLQNDFLGVENRRWILSNNQDIPILRSVQGSMGLSFKNNSWLINTDFYYKDVNGIITRSQGFQNQFEFIQDHGSYNVYGIDFLINKRFKNISTWLSYSYADNEYTFLNLNETKFPNNIDVRHNLNVAVAYSINDFKLSGGINWHSGKPITEPQSDNAIENSIINYKKPNSSRTTDYLRIDFSTTYKFKITKKIRALGGISIWNALNEENISNKFYKIHNSDENAIDEVKQFGLSFIPNIVFRLNF